MTAQMMAIGLASVILVAVFAVQVWRLFCPGSAVVAKPFFYFALIFFSLLALRLPIVELPMEINVDESQMLAQAMRFQSHPVPWRDVDGTTSGPLNSLILAAPIKLGMPATWQTARMVHVALVFVTLIFLYLTLRSFGTPLEAQLALAPTVFFYIFALYNDYCHYSSETLSVLLISGCFFLLAREWTTGVASRARLFWLGLLAGMIPFAKLQAAPLALLLALAMVALIVGRDFRTQRLRGVRWRDVITLAIGMALVPCIILAIVAASGAFNDFWISYVQANASYVQEETVWHRLKGVYKLFRIPSDFRSYLPSAIGAAAIILGVRFTWKTKFGGRLLVPIGLIAAYGALSVFCVLLAGKCFNHHLLLLVPALSLFPGLMLHVTKAAMNYRTDGPTPDSRSGTSRWIYILCVLVCGYQLYKLPDYVRHVSRYVLHPKPVALSVVAQRVLEVSRPGDTMSVWGWIPSYYLETGLAPATRDAIGHRVISSGPQQDYFRRRYLSDFKKSRPAIFIDAIGHGEFDWGWTADDRHESFAALTDFLAQDYVLWLTLPLDLPEQPLRIYLLKSRMTELKPPPDKI